MKVNTYHITRTVLGIALTFGVLIGSAFPAHADKSKTVAKGKSAVTKSTRLNTPSMNAMDAVVTTLGQKAVTPKAKVQTTTDSLRTDSRILSVHATSDVVTAKVDIGVEQQQLDVAIYNMLGKRMSEIYRGAASRGEHEYVSSISDLPEGVYICIMQGSNFRRAEKFYLSR